MSRLDDFDHGDFEEKTGLRVDSWMVVRGHLAVQAHRRGTRASRKSWFQAQYLADGSACPKRLKCPKCHMDMDAALDEPDACLGWLPGVISACCGHGDTDAAFVCPEASESLHGLAACARLQELREARIKELEAEIEGLRQVT